jgi:hypothetical protein
MGRNGNGTHDESVNRAEVPQGRKGKHRKAVADILADLSKLKAQQAAPFPGNPIRMRETEPLRLVCCNWKFLQISRMAAICRVMDALS